MPGVSSYDATCETNLKRSFSRTSLHKLSSALALKAREALESPTSGEGPPRPDT